MTERLKVVVTRPQRQAANLCELLGRIGAKAIAVPVIEILPAPSPEQVVAHIGKIDDYDVLIFVSTNAVRFGRDYLPASGFDEVAIAAVGPSTARALGEADMRCDILPPSGFSSEALLAEQALIDVDGKRVLIFRGDGGRALLGETLTERGAEVVYAEVYRRQMPESSREKIGHLFDAGGVDVVSATSVETLCNIEEMAGPQHADALHAVQLLTASDRVVKKAAQLGYTREPLLALAPDDQSLADAVQAWQFQSTTPAPGPENAGMVTDQDKPTEHSDAGDAPEAETPAQAQEQASADDAPAVEAEPIADTPPASLAVAPPPAKAKGGRLLGSLALLIALGAALLSGYNFWQAAQPEEEGPDPIAEAQALIARAKDDTQRQLSAVQSDVNDKLGRIDLSEVDDIADAQSQLERGLRGQERSIATVTDRLTGIENDLSSLRGVSASVRNTWVRAEAEYFLQTANSRLQLAHDVESALQALRAADERIGALGDPGLIPVRGKLTEEILAVEAVPRPDVEGMALALNGLAERVLELPLADTLTSRIGREGDDSMDDVQGWARAKKSVAGVFSQIVRVSPSDGSLTELMAPEQAFFLYRNLEINLQIARLALMERDTDNFRASVRTSREWLSTHFDEADPGVTNTLQRLDEMLDVDVDPEVPDISGSLRMLRAIVAASGTSQ